MLQKIQAGIPDSGGGLTGRENPACLVGGKEEPKGESFQSTAETDLIGIGGSLLCLLHCLAPQLISLGLLGASFGDFFAGETWALIFWITCFWALYQSAKNTRFPRAALALWIAFLVFSVGLVLEPFTETGKLFTYGGSVMLIASHIWNFRLFLQWSALRKKIRHSNCSGSVCKPA